MKIYVSPSSQQANLYTGGGNEQLYMNQVADILCPELIRHGIEVMRNNPSNDFQAHIAESNIYRPDYHLAIHTNAGGGIGCETLCYNADVNSKGTQLANELYRQITAISPFTGRGVKTSGLWEVTKTTAPACLIEIEFHDNIYGANWIKNNIKPIAQALLFGCLNQAGIDYMPPLDYREMYEQANQKIAEMSVAIEDAIEVLKGAL